MNTKFIFLLVSVMLIPAFVMVTGLAYGGASVPQGDWDFCSPTNPCSNGQGDCDSDADCKQGLTCTSDVGPTFGLAKGVDVCIGIEDQANSNSNSSNDSEDDDLYGGGTGSSSTGSSNTSGSSLADIFNDYSDSATDSGTSSDSNNDSWTCPFSLGHHSYCTVCEQDDANGDGTDGCDAGEGWCAPNRGHCAEGLVCDEETHKCVWPSE